MRGWIRLALALGGAAALVMAVLGPFLFRYSGSWIDVGSTSYKITFGSEWLLGVVIAFVATFSAVFLLAVAIRKVYPWIRAGFKDDHDRE